MTREFLKQWRAAVALLALGAASPPAPADFAADARELDRLIVANYAYLDRFPRGVLPDSAALTSERAAVHDRASLLHYAENRLATLADHHAIARSSFASSWALVPSYSDMWVEKRSGGFVITAVRDGKPAANAGIRPGDRLVAIQGQPVAVAVAAFWSELGGPPAADGDDYAARVLAAGRRDRPRTLTVARGGTTRTLTLASLYAGQGEAAAPVAVIRELGGGATIRFGNSLGEQGTITGFDGIMATVSPRARVTLDLTDTPSGGNTSVARAIIGWFVDRPSSYQVHSLPAEERETGIARQWIEQVLPRAGKHHPGPVIVRVGRWTGSMGEGLAIGLAATGGRVCGGAMAGLRGAVYDFTLPASGLGVKFPAERLATVGGVPREKVVPPPC